MGSRYPGRPETSNKSNIIGVRLDSHQDQLVRECAKRFDMKLSDIVREAIAVWLNMNNKGGE